MFQEDRGPQHKRCTLEKKFQAHKLHNLVPVVVVVAELNPLIDKLDMLQCCYSYMWCCNHYH